MNTNITNKKESPYMAFLVNREIQASPQVGIYGQDLAPAFSFDIDGDGEYSASVDGLLLYGYLNIRDIGVPALINNLTQQLADNLINPNGNATRTRGEEIADYLESNIDYLDIDGDGEISASIDGLLTYGYFNIRDIGVPTLINNLTQQLADNLISDDSMDIRTDATDIIDYFNMVDPNFGGSSPQISNLFWHPSLNNNWDLISVNWFNGSSNVIWNNNNSEIAIFEGSGELVKVNDNIQVAGINFISDGYVLEVDTDESLQIGNQGITGDFTWKTIGGYKSPSIEQLQSLGLQFVAPGSYLLDGNIEIFNVNSNPLLGLQNEAQVLYRGTWLGNGGNTRNNLNLINGSQLTIDSDATINFILADNHQFTRQFWVYGDGTGTLELDEGFIAEQTIDNNNPIALGAIRNQGVTLVTHSSESLPQYTRRYKIGENYLTHLNGGIDLEANSPVWSIQTNPQFYEGRVAIHTDAKIETSEDLTLNGEYLLTEDGYNFFGGLYLEEGVMLNKTGTANLNIDGDQAYRPESVIQIDNGKINFNTNPGDSTVVGKFGLSGPFLELSIASDGTANFNTPISEVASIVSEGIIEVSQGSLSVAEDLILNNGAELVLNLETNDRGKIKVTIGDDLVFDETARIVITGTPTPGNYPIFNVMGDIFINDDQIILPENIQGNFDGKTLNISDVEASNNNPVGEDDSGLGFTTDKNTIFTTGNVLENDTDPDTGDILTVSSIDTSETMGLVSDNGDGTFEYNPNGQFDFLAVGESATDSFTYTISDGNGGIDTATVIITINAQQPVPFDFGNDEKLLLLSTFDNDGFEEGWTLESGMAIENGELILADGQWQAAHYDLATLDNLDLDNGPFMLYWKARGDRSKTELAKFFVEANLSPPSEGENELKMAVRPSRTGVNPENEYHHLYLDKGFQVPHLKDSFLHIPDGQFPDSDSYEQFRLKVEKTGEDTVEVSPFYWNKNENIWQPFTDFLNKSLTSSDWTTPVPTPLSLSIKNDLGQDFFDSITLLFRSSGYSAIDAFAITNLIEEKVILEDNFVDLSNWTDLSELISWGNYPTVTSGFSTDTNNGQQAVFLNRAGDGDGIDTEPWTGIRETNDLKAFTALDFVFPEAINRRQEVLTIEFDARWDTLSNSGESGRLLAILMDQYPTVGVSGNDLSDFSGNPYGKPALHLRIRPSNIAKSLLQYGGGGDRQFEIYGDTPQWWLPGFITNTPGTGNSSPGQGNEFPNGSWKATTENLGSQDWTSFTYKILPYRQEVYENGQLVGFMDLPENLLTAPQYEYYDQLDALRLYWRGVEPAYVSNLRITTKPASLGDEILGDADVNLIAGGIGNDVLTGGGGADSFIYYNPEEGEDIITDFNGDDQFHISAAGFGGGLIAGVPLTNGTASDTGVLVFGEIPIGDSANFLYSGGILSFDPDGIGPETKTTIANLSGAPSLDVPQFQIQD